MFAKPFRVKSNTAIKGSDRRKLKADVQSAFPSLSGAELSHLIPNKEELNVVKMYLHKGDVVTAYVLNKNPIFFEMNRRLYPTVYTLWSCPDLLVAFTTWPAVLTKLAGGADLMLPGVVVPPSGLPELQQGDLCAINLVENRAPVAIGLVTMPTADMLAAGMKGKGVTTLHTYLDLLWAFGEKTSPPVIPHISHDPGGIRNQLQEEEKGEEKEEVAFDADDIENLTAELDSTEKDTPDMRSLCLNEETASEHTPSATIQVRDQEAHDGDVVDLKEITEDSENHHDTENDYGTTKIVGTVQEQMDELLLQCFLHALKFKVKKADLPLLTSTFLKVHVYPCCPEGQQLDIKKSSYKKLSKFLLTMQQRQILQMKELSKGVESITGVNWKHADLQSFKVPETVTGEEMGKIDRGSDTGYQPPEIKSFYNVSSKLIPLFEHADLKKDAALSNADVRSIITNYVKSNDLIDDYNKNYVTINPTLCDCILEKSEYHTVTKLTWDDLFSRCLKSLQQCHEVTFPGQKPKVRKGQIKPIDIDVVQRASNKKVTVITNLEEFGLDPQILGNALQQKAQASVTITPVPGTKGKMALQVQGNQVNHIAKLLTEEHRIAPKYIRGLEKAPKSGKKKR
ncbi:eukaryotic translation initiation factor 2D isoform X1 [Chiloscyllium plagiosum]|uniref:eukaryotic translation initiation factor 2D isoform X1 n=2 Tax=Chiloscyllium plagiosum TaxID=36176 RepID=UPI001CB7B2BE|nr:eukaryotic translation initiation factor 2D isoform X1 [Chiloscyllium plagiosum]